MEQIMRIRNLHDDVTTMRLCGPEMCRKILTQAYKAELNNLFNADVVLDDVELKIPDPKKVPPIIECDSDFEERIERLKSSFERTVDGMKLL